MNSFKKFSLLIMLVLGVLFVTSCKRGEPEIEKQNRIIESTLNSFEKKLLENRLDSIVSKFNFNGVVSIYRDSIKIYEKANGYSDFTKKTELNSETIFPIASNSKQFTAVLILKLAEENRLKVTEKVSQYLKEFDTPAYREITIEQLLNHTSGLGIMGQALAFESGSKFKYSNDGYDMLGKVVEEVSGKSFSENLFELFEEVGLEHIFSSDNLKDTNFSSAFLGNQNNAVEVPNMPKRLAGEAVGIPSGGILTNAPDFHKWQRKLYSGEILDSISLLKMTNISSVREDYLLGNVGYGYGLMINMKNPIAYFHTGYVKGAPSLTIYYPETRTSIVILSNLSDETQPRNITFRPHNEIKEAVDALQNTLIELRAELLVD